MCENNFGLLRFLGAFSHNLAQPNNRGNGSVGYFWEIDGELCLSTFSVVIMINELVPTWLNIYGMIVIKWLIDQLWTKLGVLKNCVARYVSVIYIFYSSQNSLLKWVPPLVARHGQLNWWCLLNPPRVNATTCTSNKVNDVRRVVNTPWRGPGYIHGFWIGHWSSTNWVFRFNVGFLWLQPYYYQVR